MFAFADGDSDENEDKDEVLDTKTVAAATVGGGKRLASSAFNFQQEEDEEEDEDIVPQQLVHAQSTEYVDARQAVEEDPWDCASWLKIIDEARAHRSGTLTLVEACELFLEQFPKSASVWYLYCETLLQQRDDTKAEQMLKKSARSCRSVAIWRLYLQFSKSTLDRMTHRDENYQAERRSVELLFEQAVDSVGLCLDSSSLWRMYIDFVRDAHDFKAEDPGKKLATLRRLYQRCSCTPCDHMDEFYREYVALEKSKSEELAEKQQAEFGPKHAAARAIYKEKRRLMNKIDTNKLARAPFGPGWVGAGGSGAGTSCVTELEQLEAWSRYLRYDRNMEDSELMDPGLHRQVMTLAFEQCLCHFRHYPEVWLAYAKYVWVCHKEQGAAAASVLPIRAIYREAISIIPYCALLRISWAELEEEFGNVEIARDILKQCYELVPSALSFSVLQRFVRKKDGKSAARKCFSETLPLRREGRLGVEAMLAHAELELNVNTDPRTALNILELALKSTNAAAGAGGGGGAGGGVAGGGLECDISYVRLMSRVLLQLGDIERLRYLFHSALDALGGVVRQAQAQAQARTLAGRDSAAAGAAATAAAAGGAAGGVGAGEAGCVVTIGGNLPAVNATYPTEAGLRAQWLLWEEFHCMENAFGSSDLLRLNRVRDCRNAARAAYIERHGAGELASVASTQVGGNLRYVGFNLGASLSELLQTNERSYSVFTPSVLLFERYDNMSFPLVVAPSTAAAPAAAATTPACADYMLKMRSRGPAYVDELARREEDRAAGGSRLRGPGASGSGRQSAEELAASDEALGVPPVLRELLNKLPSASAAAQAEDIDSFVDHLRRQVLPPRPLTDVLEDVSGVRAPILSGGVFGGMEEEEDEDEDAPGAGTASLAGAVPTYAEGMQPTVDIFQQRQRARLGLNR